MNKREKVIGIDEELSSVYPEVSNPERVSEWERIFYTLLAKKGIRVIPQYQVDQYTLDFALLNENGKKRLNIEIDGEQFHRNWTGELCRKDQVRDYRLIEIGWDVKRFLVHQVRDEPDECVKSILEWIEDNNKED